MKKLLIYTTIISLISLSLFGCLLKKDNRVYTVVEQMPEFPGGELEMQKFIFINLKMPKEEDSQYCFSPYVRFIVTQKGDIRNIGIKKTDCPLSDSLAKVVKSMPRWIPGRYNNKPVDVYFNLSIQISPKY